MLFIKCPWCGSRDEKEYRFGGESAVVRPKVPDAIDDNLWADYLYNRNNYMGLHEERWFHEHGCRRWFNLVRNTLTNEIVCDPETAVANLKMDQK